MVLIPTNRTPTDQKADSQEIRIKNCADALSNQPMLRPARGGAGRGGRKGTRVMAQQGTVKFFNLDKGFGFIKPDSGGRDIFVHVTALERAGLRSLAEGQRVSFDIEPDKKGKGPKAVNLQLV